MKPIRRLFRKQSSGGKRRPDDYPPTDLAVEIATIERIEKEQEIGLGRRIHVFSFQELELQLDRDITGMYRLVALQGSDRKFSFSIRCDHMDYAALLSSFEEIIRFLKGNRHIANLPNEEKLKGFYFGST